MDKIESLLEDLTLEEKISIISGSDAWHSTGVDRLSIPRIKMTDGPIGARGDSTSGATSACFPSATALSSTWDKETIEQIGEAIGAEAKTKDADVLLGPTINLHRHPLGGRHFECYSEDPFLTGVLAVGYVKGVQSQGVSACLKHFIGNDTEFERHRVSSNIDDRVLREMYLLPFEMGVKQGGSLSVMSAYNRLNNIYCSSHKTLLIDILKEEWNFPGYVVSDWGAALDAVGNANGGLDLEMPGPAKTWGEHLLKLVNSGEVSQEIITDKVRRILRVAEFTGRLDDPTEKEERSINKPEDRSLIRRTASEGMVLLKNQSLLPLDKSQLKKVAVIGPNAKIGQFLGGGSAGLNPHYVVHPLEGIEAALAGFADVLYAKGCHTHKFLPAIDKTLLQTDNQDKEGYKVEFFDGNTFDSEPIHITHMSGRKFWAFNGFGLNELAKSKSRSLSARFTAEFTPDIDGEHFFEIFGIGPSRMIMDDEEVIDNWSSQDPGETFFALGSAPRQCTLTLEKGRRYKLSVEYQWSGKFPAVQFGMLAPDPHNFIDEAVNLASDSDVVVLIVGTNSDWETEGYDRTNLNLPNNQDELITKICKVNPNTVVVMNTGSPCAMPWHDDAKAILQCWFPGQEFGNSLSDILFGEVNPSGKLPTTFPKDIKDTPIFSHYPGEDLQMDYVEGLYIGYRWYEKEGIEPLFPFGHGLSYTNFQYQDLRVVPPKGNGTAVAFEIKVTNTGAVKGKEIIQCYVGSASSYIERPLKELKAFSKIELEPLEARTVLFELTERDLSYWDEGSNQWKIEPSEYKVSVGASSKDIREEVSVWLG
jgi:beta-glucosidase